MTREQTPNHRDRRPKTVSISLRERGQTTQDFAVGIGVFILAVAFVFSFVPSILTPFDSTVSGGQTAQADRIADQLVANLSDSDRPNDINGTAFQQYADESDLELAAEFGLRTNSNDNLIDRINVSVEYLNETDQEPLNSSLTFGHEYTGQSAASSARVVTFQEGPSDYEERAAYRLVVRVW